MTSGTPDPARGKLPHIPYELISTPLRAVMDHLPSKDLSLVT